MSNPIYHQQNKRKDRLLALGLCVSCGTSKADGWYCEECKKKRRPRVNMLTKERYQLLKAHGICPNCKDLATDGIYCRPCANKRRVNPLPISPSTPKVEPNERGKGAIETDSENAGADTGTG